MLKKLLPDTAIKAFINISLTNGALSASDSIPSDGSMSAVYTPPSSDLAVLPVPTLHRRLLLLLH